MKYRMTHSWCAEAQYPGLTPFLLGTVVLPSDARHDQIVAALEDHARAMLPDGFEINGAKLKGGALWFVPDEKEAA